MAFEWWSVAVKFLHVGAIAFWSAGLIALPFLYRQRTGLEAEALYRLHAFARFLYVGIVSPAAFVAIASGTALIFIQGTYEAWFFVKLALVAAMTGIHIFSGLMVLRLFEPDGHYPLWRLAVVAPSTLAVVTTILALVLAKPQLDLPSELSEFFVPGALSRHVGGIIGDWK
jgi:protoporphyrinogen IX oxidase